MARGAFDSVCETRGLDQKNDQDDFIEYLQRIGAIQYYEDSGLEDWVFLKPEWVTQAIYHIFTNKKIKEDNGVFTQKWLKAVWKEKKYNETDIMLLEKLLLHRHFEICYPLDDEYSKFIMPLWLPEERPDYTLTKSYQSRYGYQYAYLQIGFVSHLIIRFHAARYLKKNSHDDTPLHWRKGLLLEYKGGVVEIIQSGEGQHAKIHVTYRGNSHSVSSLISIVTTEIDKLHQQFAIQYQRNAADINVTRCTRISYNYGSLEARHIVRLRQDAEFQGGINAGVAIECPHSVVIGKGQPEYFQIRNLVAEVKDNGANIYQSNFTCSQCKTEIVPEQLVEGTATLLIDQESSRTEMQLENEHNRMPNEHESIAIHSTPKERLKLAERICYREFIDNKREDKETGKKLSQNYIALKSDVNHSSVSRMLKMPVNQGGPHPGQQAYLNVLTAIKSNKKEFDTAYLNIIEVVASNEVVYYELLEIESLANPFLLKTKLEEINKMKPTM